MPVGISAWTPLANITLGSALTSVTFSSISQSYTDLVLVVSNIRSSTNTNNILIRMNTDSLNNYSYVSMRGNGSTASPDLQTSQSSLRAVDNLVPDTTNPGMIVAHFFDYATTNKNKTILFRTDFPSTTFAGTGLAAGVWNSTSAINSFVFFQQNAATFSAGTNFALYGVTA